MFTTPGPGTAAIGQLMRERPDLIRPATTYDGRTFRITWTETVKRIAEVPAEQFAALIEVDSVAQLAVEIDAAGGLDNLDHYPLADHLAELGDDTINEVKDRTDITVTLTSKD